jgi:hypothetical protein
LRREVARKLARKLARKPADESGREARAVCRRPLVAQRTPTGTRASTGDPTPAHNTTLPPAGAGKCELAHSDVEKSLGVRGALGESGCGAWRR